LKSIMSIGIKMLSVEEIKERLAPLYNMEGLELVLLFGSCVSGKLHTKSDIDIAFLSNKPVDILAVTNKAIHLLSTDKVDVVNLKFASPLLKFSLAKRCIILYERYPGLFNSFFSLAFRRYIDTKKLREAQSEAINDFLKERKLI